MLKICSEKRNIFNFKCSQNFYMHTFYKCLTQRLKNGAAGVVRIFFRVEKARPSRPRLLFQIYTILLQSSTCFIAYVRGSNYTSRIIVRFFKRYDQNYLRTKQFKKMNTMGANRNIFYVLLLTTYFIIYNILS
jgi:hypothetical protein